MKIFATRLPRRPPTVKIAVTNEKTKLDICMHVGKELLRKLSSACSHVRTALIWFKADV